MDFTKRISLMLPYMPLAAAAFVAICAGVSVATYKAPAYAIEENALDTESRLDGADRKTVTAETTEAETVEETAIAVIEESGIYIDGEYEGRGTGFSGTVTVKVTVAEGKIAEIVVLDAADEDPWFKNAKALLGNIVEAQSTNVEAVSGATYSSKGIIEAVRDALDKAAGGEGTFDAAKATTAAKATSKAGASRTVSKISEPAAYKDGTYTGSATGFGGRLSVRVTVSDGRISTIDVTSHNETSSYYSKAKKVLSRMISAQSTNVDTVSGATYSSVGLINAVRNALSKAGGGASGVQDTYETIPTVTDMERETNAPLETIDEKEGWRDGTYTGTAEGFVDDIVVEVVVEGGRITSIKVTSQDETPEFYEKAVTLIDQMLSGQTTNVDAVSGATYSSEGIIGAVRAALKDAKTEDAAAEPALEEDSASGTEPASEAETTTEPISGPGTGNPAEPVSGPETGNAGEPVSGSETGSAGEPISGPGTGSTTEPISEQDAGAADTSQEEASSSDNEPQPDKAQPSSETEPDSSGDPTDIPTSRFKSGTYTVKVVCAPDEYEDFEPYNLIVDVKIENDVITAVENVSGDGAKTNQRYIKKAASGLLGQLLNRADIVGEQSIDAVSGATCTSNAIARACAKALERAKN